MLTKNIYLNSWIKEVSDLTNPKDIHICTGSIEEEETLKQILLNSKDMVKLNPEKYPNCYLYRSNPNDVARTENLTYICTSFKEEAGPNNNWMSPEEAHKKANSILKNSMSGRTMYVLPYVMGPLSSPYSKCGVEITDSPYVVLNMLIMTRAGSQALEKIEEIGGDCFTKGLHSIVDLSIEKRNILHFPEENLIISTSTGYGGNALLGKKCHSLRIGSWQARQEGWLAEHMLILGVQTPDDKIYYMAAAFPSGCGKTNLAMLKAPLEMKGYKVWTLGDDIAWLHLDKEGYLRAINPEAGLFGIVPGTSEKTNYNAYHSIMKDTIFTNVALNLDDMTPWWEGKDDKDPRSMNLVDWKGNPYTGEGPAAHPNSRFTTSIKNCPSYSSMAEDPEGVVLSAIIFGGRREQLTPLVMEAKNWTHGVFLGACAASETTAAATTKIGVVRRDPMAMKPFCCYNFSLYWNHWLSFKDKSLHLPKIFHVNWFRKENSKFIWPGFSDNLRVLAWIIDSCNGKDNKIYTPIGFLPKKDSLNLSNMNISDTTLDTLLSFNPTLWEKECSDILDYFSSFGNYKCDTLIKECLNIKEELQKWDK